jgi:hypothetical protein
VFLTSLLPFGLQKCRQPLRSRSAVRLPSVDPVFSTEDMAKGETFLKKRVTPLKGKKSIPCHDDGNDSWYDELKAKYQREGVPDGVGGTCDKEH